VPDGAAGRGDRWKNLRLKIKMSGGRVNGGGEGEQRAERNTRQVLDGGQMGCRMGAMSSATSILNAMSPV
jgi:hypothetical protein